MGVAAVIATVSIHNLVHMAITQLYSSHSGDTPSQQQTALPAQLHAVLYCNGEGPVVPGTKLDAKQA